MVNLHVDYQDKDLDFTKARRIALQSAMFGYLWQPAIISWHQRSSHAFSPAFEGADENTWWQKYGVGNGGKVEVCVGGDFEFVIGETGGYETLEKIPLRNLSDTAGNEYLCFAPMLDDTGVPREDACVLLDEWLAKQN